MLLDPNYLIQTFLFSKIMNNPTGFKDIPFYVYIGISIYFFYRFLPYKITDSIQEYILDKIFENNESSIIIPYHSKTFSSYGGKSLERTIYSERFHAITYYIIKNHVCDFSSMNETIKFEKTNYYGDGENDFILLPKQCNKIIIKRDSDCDKHGKPTGIYFEIISESMRENDNSDKDGEESNKKTNYSRSSNKKYIYKLSKSGKGSLKILHDFLGKIIQTYRDEVVNKVQQQVFEFISTIKDDDDSITMKFKDSPFYSNKNFQNIFFERKSEFIEFISKFNSLKHASEIDIVNRQIAIDEYKRVGDPYKAAIFLHGPPGCGKSSLIKATAEFTGRHCILVPWTKIKTCQDFVSLFRPLKIGDKEYQPRELIIVFEDFDANSCEILKTRTNLKQDLKQSKNNKIEDTTDTTDTTDTDFPEDSTDEDVVEKGNISEDTVKKLKTQLDKLMKNQIITFPTTNSDELTLEYILNTLDGIVELNDAIIFFTTNDIDSIDPALIRPGRIDYILKMGKTSNKMIRELLEYRYKCVLDNEQLEYIHQIRDGKYSYAELCETCKEYSCIKELFQSGKLE